MVAMAAFAAASELYLPIILCVFTSRSVRHFETFPLQRRFYCSVGNLSPIPPKRPDAFEAPVLGTLPGASSYPLAKSLPIRSPQLLKGLQVLNW
jgi:hypothetical protein